MFYLILSCLVLLTPTVSHASKAETEEFSKEIDAHNVKSVNHELNIENLAYSVNFLWINAEKPPTGIFVKYSEKASVFDTYLSNIREWKNHHKSVNFWYDSEFLDINALEAEERLKGVAFKDIRTLKYVKDHAPCFSSRLPVYFRVDLLKAILSYEEVTQENPNSISIFADMDIKAIEKEELFDKSTMKKLTKFGIVMGGARHACFENQFQILSFHNGNLLKAMKIAVIDLNLERAKSALKFTKRPPEELRESVYGSYNTLFYLFWSYEKIAQLKVVFENFDERTYERLPDTEEIYDEAKHGLLPFRTFYKPELISISNDNGSYSCIDFKVVFFDPSFKPASEYPTKKIEVSDPSLNYY